jgi:hypothetical protein
MKLDELDERSLVQLSMTFGFRLFRMSNGDLDMESSKASLTVKKMLEGEEERKEEEEGEEVARKLEISRATFKATANGVRMF